MTETTRFITKKDGPGGKRHIPINGGSGRSRRGRFDAGMEDYYSIGSERECRTSGGDWVATHLSRSRLGENITVEGYCRTPTHIVNSSTRSNELKRLTSEESAIHREIDFVKRGYPARSADPPDNKYTNPKYAMGINMQTATERGRHVGYKGSESAEWNFHRGMKFAREHDLDALTVGKQLMQQANIRRRSNPRMSRMFAKAAHMAYDLHDRTGG